MTDSTDNRPERPEHEALRATLGASEKSPVSGASQQGIVSRDRMGRRDFLRRDFLRKGSALVAAGTLGASTVMTVQAQERTDCDRNEGMDKNTTPNSDTDAGAGSDVAGCGRKLDKPKISERPDSIETRPGVTVKKINA